MKPEERKRKKKGQQVTAKQSDASQESVTSTLDDSTDRQQTPAKKMKDLPIRQHSTPSADSILYHFQTRPRSQSLSAVRTEQNELALSSGHTGAAAHLPNDVSNFELLEQLRRNGKHIQDLKETIGELKTEILLLKNENDRMKADLEGFKRREDLMKGDLKLAKYRVALADDRNNALEQYGRNYNLRLYHVPEPEGEKAADCEDTVLKILHSKMGLRHITKDQLDAVHRLGRKQTSRGVPRGIIIRFVSRRTRDEVLTNRRKLRSHHPQGRSPVIVEDLTKRNYQLLMAVRDSDVTSQCWTTRGKVYVKAHNGKIMHVKTKADLQDSSLKSSPPRRRLQNSSQTELKRVVGSVPAVSPRSTQPSPTGSSVPDSSAGLDKSVHRVRDFEVPEDILDTDDEANPAAQWK